MTALERRYRRLLTWYPKDHRARHEEEMLAVLLAASAPGQSRPSGRDAFDLVRGGLAIRLRRVAPPGSRRHWRAPSTWPPSSPLSRFSAPACPALPRSLAG
ncbi:hypothetical protein OHA25_17455 [Nonomuraea sp. NBC_00507]|uniref:hypothetical protein n=1 Tax=Nonomuraea sp. NBC_00507 TaxID=2976002 RepID=UPI002E197638